jgi:RNA polymerase sigma factor (sigma-70 family)
MLNLETRAASRVGSATPADAELLARWCTAGDAAAFEVLVRRHGGMVLGVCRRVLGDSADADDAFQATFLVFIQKARTLTRPEQVAGWMHAVALRVAKKARTTRARRREREAVNVVPDTPDPANPDPADSAHDLRRTIDEELDRLPEKYRLPIVLCELEGRTLDEAAELLGWPKGTVAGRLSRGRELLRRRLSRRGVGLPLFLIVPGPALELAAPSEPLVSAAVAGAVGSQGAAGTAALSAAPPGELARAVLRDGFRRRIGLLALLLITAMVLAALGLFAGPVLARMTSPVPPAEPSAPAAPAGCHAPIS